MVYVVGQIQPQHRIYPFYVVLSRDERDAMRRVLNHADRDVRRVVRQQQAAIVPPDATQPLTLIARYGDRRSLVHVYGPEVESYLPTNGVIVSHALAHDLGLREKDAFLVERGDLKTVGRVTEELLQRRREQGRTYEADSWHRRAVDW